MTVSTPASIKRLLKRVSKHIRTRLVLTLMLIALSGSLLGCTSAEGATARDDNPSASSYPSSSNDSSELVTATFAGGCFWCMEQPFDALPGVAETTSGYTGGTVENPTYYQVSNGNTGHVEAMQVSYDPTKVTYHTLLDTFWHNVDPLDNRGQFCDKGSQYRSAIFYETPEQQALAEETKQALAEQFAQPIATDILPAATFYPAEDYHQNYYKTRPIRYKVYRYGCGRDQRLSDIWGSAAPVHE